MSIDKENQLLGQVVLSLLKRARNAADPFRPGFHLSPDVGLLNDPNGFIHYQGKYHLFYQWNPLACKHGAKFWGHVTSTDLLHWEHQPVALVPAEEYERNGCYSGSAIEQDGKLLLCYTGNVKFAEGGRTAYQCIAEVAEDGVHKWGPVADLPEGYTGHVRDPKVWRHGDAWYMVLAAQDLDLQGKVLLYRSGDLRAWQLLGEIAGSRLGGMGDFGYMWECPDLFELGGQEVLICCPQGLQAEGDRYQNLFQCGYFIGSLDYEQAQFSHGEFTELDLGFDFYAPQTTQDASGRRLLFGWMGLPDDNEAHQPTIEHGWIHCMTLPRELVLVGDRVHQRPVTELTALRGDVLVEQQVSGVTPLLISSECELLLKPDSQPFMLHWCDVASVEFDGQQLTLARRNWRTGEWEQRRCELAGLTELRLFYDHSTLEVFANEGEVAMSARCFPEAETPAATLTSDAPMEVHCWQINPCF